MTDDSTLSVLVVEDDMQLADLFVEQIPDMFTTRIANSVSEAIERLDPSLDVLVLDRGLDQPGRTVLDHVQSNDIDCQVIIVSGYAESTAENIDFDAYLHKPVTGTELVKTLKLLTGSESGDRPSKPMDSTP